MRLLLVLMFSLSASAENWMRPKEVASGSVRGFSMQNDCIVDANVCQQVDGLVLEHLTTQTTRLGTLVIINDQVAIDADLKAVSDAAAKETARKTQVARVKSAVALEPPGIVKDLGDLILQNQ